MLEYFFLYVFSRFFSRFSCLSLFGLEIGRFSLIKLGSFKSLKVLPFCDNGHRSNHEAYANLLNLPSE